ncbi:hypothetical protein PIB30_024388 [Stylosanthes scabra]|uniref:Ubiquitin carboxyl-terminal hydrolase n=1 Tax=Stylosanthes scabra TaxID=79078 RepID=A0ABU6S9R9_9FABA|nr:hypothetical protein [Stylosanthes scabra]
MSKRSRNKNRRQRRGSSAATRRPSAAARKRNAPDDDDDQDSPPPQPRPLPPPTAQAPPSSATPQEPLPLPPPPGFEDVTPTTYDPELFKNLEPLQTVKPSHGSSSLLVSDLSGKEYDPSISIPKLPELDEALEEPAEIGLIDNSSSSSPCSDDDYDEDDEADPHTPRGAFDDDDDLFRYKMFILQQIYVPTKICDEFLPIPVPTGLKLKIIGPSPPQEQGAAESNTVSDDDPSSPTCGAGIVNEGNTCYMNAILQSLTHTVPFVDAIRSCNHITPCTNYDEQSVTYCAICALRDHVNAALLTPRRPVKPTRLVNKLNHFSPHFSVGRQEDSHEFMLQVFSKIVACFPDGAPNPVDTVFRGQTVSRLTCCTPDCDHFSDTPELIRDLNLEIENVESVKGALESFTKVEKVEANCDKCKERVAMGKQLLLKEAPQIAVLHLKRFKKVETGSNYTKIDKDVKYEVDLDLKEYTTKEEENVKVKYDLYAIVVHSGNPDSGHYYCIVRTDEDNWHKLNDAQVTRVTKEEALEEPAYLLFYAQHGTPWFVSSVITTEGKPVDAKPEEENVAAKDHTPEKVDDGATMDACNENVAKDDAQENVNDGGPMNASNENAATDNIEEKVFDDDPMDAYNESAGPVDEEESTDKGSSCGQKNL